MVEPIARLLRRAQAAGAVRDDLEPEDVLFLISAVGHVVAVPVRHPGSLAALPRGRARRHAARGRQPLAPPAPTMDEVEAALAAAAQAPRPRA